MIAATASMEFVSTATETEALLLEANYIKQMRPRFNVLLRDDKSFPYILITGDHRAPQILKHRGAHSRKGDYFGPFASVNAVNRTLNALQRAFLLRSCSDSYFENRTRPCLLYQIKRCSGPCTQEISGPDYAALVDEARGFLSGRSRLVRDRLAEEMVQAAELMEFERAARLRDRIAALSAIQGSQGINPRSLEEADVFAVTEQAGQFAVEVFFFRTGAELGQQGLLPARRQEPRSRPKCSTLFSVQFYLDRPAPRLILLSHEIEDRAVLEELLSERARLPRRDRGAAARRKERARRPGDPERPRGAEPQAGRYRQPGKTARSLAAAFGVTRAIRRVEVYDNSHIMGTNAIGAMIVAGPSGFMKTQYRTFNIKDRTLTPGDDFGMMREVLGRRFARLVREGRAAPASADVEAAEVLPDSDEAPAWPDLILIDGGKGQVEAVRAVLEDLGVPQMFGATPDPQGVAVVGIAKGPDRNAGRETFFIAGRETFKLGDRDPALYFVQRLRDEAHRFAIGTHRARRKKDFVRNPLDEIGGIGPSRKRALLHAFGTAKAIGRASLDDLAKVPGVNAAVAKRIYDFFHDQP